MVSVLSPCRRGRGGGGGEGGGGGRGPGTQEYSLLPRLNPEVDRVSEFFETHKMHLNITGDSDGECPFPLQEGSCVGAGGGGGEDEGVQGRRNVLFCRDLIRSWSESVSTCRPIRFT